MNSGVVKWPACSPSTPTIRVQIPLKSTVLFYELFEKDGNWQKEAGDGLFKNKNIINNQSHEEKKREKWLKVESGPSKRLEENECDQIWQIFATLGQRRKTLTLLKGLNLFLAKLRSCLGKFYMLLGKFSLLPMATKYLTKNLVIWSHWRERTWTDEGTVSLSLSLSPRFVRRQWTAFETNSSTGNWLSQMRMLDIERLKDHSIRPVMVQQGYSLKWNPDYNTMTITFCNSDGRRNTRGRKWKEGAIQPLAKALPTQPKFLTT